MKRAMNYELNRGNFLGHSFPIWQLINGMKIRKKYKISALTE